MPKISSYTTSTPALTDKLLGTDVDGTPSNATKNFTVESVAEITKNTILPETTTQTPVLTDKVFGSNDSGNPRTPNRNFTVQGIRDTIIPATSIDVPLLTDKIFGSDDANPQVPNQHYTLQGVKNLIAPPQNLVLNTQNFSNQELTAANTKTQVSFGSAVSNSYVDLNAAGDVEILTAGNYFIRVAINCGAIQTSASDRHVDYYFTVESGGNAVPPSQAYPTIQNTVFFDASDFNPAQTLIQEYPFFNVAANTVIDFYWSGSVYSSAPNPGQFRTALVNRDTGTSGFFGVPSAAIQIIKL